MSSYLLLPMRHLPAGLTAGRFPMDVPACNIAYSDPTCALHLHDYEGKLWIGKSLIRLRPGDVTLSPPHVESRYDLPRSGHHLCIHFDSARPETRGARFRLPLHFHLGPRAVSARERIVCIIDHYRRAGDRGDSPSSVAASAALLELLLWLHVQSRSRSTLARNSLAEESLARLRQVMDGSLHRQITVPELAAQSGLNADYVARLFRQRCGMTIPRYLLLRRMELARHLLLSSNFPIKEVGGRVGIPDPQYFNKQFRRVVGFSPTAYRLEQRLPPSRLQRENRADASA